MIEMLEDPARSAGLGLAGARTVQTEFDVRQEAGKLARLLAR